MEEEFLKIYLNNTVLWFKIFKVMYMCIKPICCQARLSQLKVKKVMLKVPRIMFLKLDDKVACRLQLFLYFFVLCQFLNSM